MLVTILLLSLLFEAPAYVVPQDPWDPALATDLLEALYKKGVAVQRATQPFEANGKQYPAGTRIIPANSFLDSLSIEMGVPVEPLDRAVTVPQQPITQFHAEGSFRGQGHMTTLDHRDNSAFIATAFLLDRYEGVGWTADGTIILHSWYADGFARADNFSKQFVVRITLTDDPNLKAAYELHRPRVALLHAPAWLTQILDDNAAPYDAVESIAGRFDTIITTGSGDFDAFVRAGGTLIRLPESSGTPQRISIDAANPIAFGMPRETRVMGTASEGSGEAIAKFEKGAPALEEQTMGKGRIITFHFRPQPGTVKLLLNAIYLASATRV
jgi:hypothetical protein